MTQHNPQFVLSSVLYESYLWSAYGYQHPDETADITKRLDDDQKYRIELARQLRQVINITRHYLGVPNLKNASDSQKSLLYAELQAIETDARTFTCDLQTNDPDFEMIPHALNDTQLIDTLGASDRRRFKLPEIQQFLGSYAFEQSASRFD